LDIMGGGGGGGEITPRKGKKKDPTTKKKKKNTNPRGENKERLDLKRTEGKPLSARKNFLIFKKSNR